jgi:hypothetical protein
MIATERFEPLGFKLPPGFKDNRLLLAAAEECSMNDGTVIAILQNGLQICVGADLHAKASTQVSLFR